MHIPSWEEQLKIMMESTVFITTQGSSGFRYLFMPKGARVIVIGSPSGPEQNKRFPQPFFELDEFFRINYLTFFLYPVDVKYTSEYDLRSQLLDGTFVVNPTPLYDAHIKVDLDRISHLVASALKV